MIERHASRPEGERLTGEIRCGDKVTILVHAGIGRHGPELMQRTGRAVMRGPAGWVLNMGGPHGTPGVATPDNIIAVKHRKEVAP